MANKGNQREGVILITKSNLVENARWTFARLIEIFVSEVKQKSNKWTARGRRHETPSQLRF